jgi:hypothetical protein
MPESEDKIAGAPIAPSRKIHPTRFKQADLVRNMWSIVPEDGTPYEALFKPVYWSHIAARLRPGDRIEVTAEDFSYAAELMVVAAERQAASVVELRKTEIGRLAQLLPSVEAAYRVEFKGPHLKWCVIRVADQTRVREQCDSRSLAYEWLASHSKALAA